MATHTFKTPAGEPIAYKNPQHGWYRQDVRGRVVPGLDAAKTKGLLYRVEHLKRQSIAVAFSGELDADTMATAIEGYELVDRRSGEIRMPTASDTPIPGTWGDVFATSFPGQNGWLNVNWLKRNPTVKEVRVFFRPSQSDVWAKRKAAWLRRHLSPAVTVRWWNGATLFHASPFASFADAFKRGGIEAWMEWMAEYERMAAVA